MLWTSGIKGKIFWALSWYPSIKVLKVHNDTICFNFMPPGVILGQNCVQLFDAAFDSFFFFFFFQKFFLLKYSANRGTSSQSCPFIVFFREKKCSFIFLPNAAFNFKNNIWPQQKVFFSSHWCIHVNQSLAIAYRNWILSKQRSFRIFF